MMVLLLAALAAAVPPIATETVSEPLRAGDGTTWRTGYDVAFDGEAVRLTVAVRLVAGRGVTAADVHRVRTTWEAAAERVWDGRLALAVDGARYPVRFDLVFLAPSYHHEVVVAPGAGASHALHWNLQDPPDEIAHEVGHLLGAWDEYAEGAVDPEHPRVADDSVMGRLARVPEPHPRHLWTVARWLEGHLGRPVQVVLVKDSP